jgi:hypothetical protein
MSEQVAVERSEVIRVSLAARQVFGAKHSGAIFNTLHDCIGEVTELDKLPATEPAVWLLIAASSWVKATCPQDEWAGIAKGLAEGIIRLMQPLPDELH